jgi:hypothetical protein
MTDPKELRERAKELRRIARRTTQPGTINTSGLLALADRYNREAGAAEARSFAGNKPRATQRVQPGQRYRVAGSSFSIWEVIEVISHPGQPLPHVRLARVGEPKDLKMVSLSVLGDRRFYESA